MSSIRHTHTSSPITRAAASSRPDHHGPGTGGNRASSFLGPVLVLLFVVGVIVFSGSRFVGSARQLADSLRATKAPVLVSDSGALTPSEARRRARRLAVEAAERARLSPPGDETVAVNDD